MKKENENVHSVSVKLIVVSLLFLAALYIFGYLADEVVLEKEDLFDTTVFHFLARFATPGIIEAARHITFFGSSTFFLPAYTLLVLYFVWRRKRSYALDIALVGISSTILLHTIKNLFRRERPAHPIYEALTNYSFPSGHALSSFIFCSVLIYVIWNGRWPTLWKWVTAVLLFLFALAIGISRVVLRYHYASDVLAGMCLGFAWVLFSLWLLKKIRRVQKQPGQQAGRT